MYVNKLGVTGIISTMDYESVFTLLLLLQNKLLHNFYRSVNVLFTACNGHIFWCNSLKVAIHYAIILHATGCKQHVA